MADQITSNMATNGKSTEMAEEIAGVDLLKLYQTICPPRQETFSVSHLWEVLSARGILQDDPRLDNIRQLVREKARPAESNRHLRMIYPDLFREMTGQSKVLRKALMDDLSIPDFQAFIQAVSDVFVETRSNRDGKVANYIPQLARMDPEYFAVSVCTIDGQRSSWGDSKVDFCLQSTCKPIMYSIAQEELGQEKVHQHIGFEPSGLGFNELSLDRNNLPHNPMINAGAIMSSALIMGDRDPADRFDHVMQIFAQLAGGVKPDFNNSVYLSERRTADRNFALAYYMRENQAFPPNINLTEVLEFYFQCCSIEVNAEMVSVMAATLANGGICPLTGVRVFQDRTVQNCLSLMLTCGMYDYSGRFAFEIGLPAKSGVSGALMVVIPGRMGICTYSPKLDELGNSVRGVEFCQRLSKQYNVHQFDMLGDDRSERDVSSRKFEAEFSDTVALIASASLNDQNELQRLIATGMDVNQGDYDYRTALHLAAAEGHLDAVELLLRHGAEVNPKDRWGGTPMTDAKRGNHQEVINLLKQHGGQ